MTIPLRIETLSTNCMPTIRKNLYIWKVNATNNTRFSRMGHLGFGVRCHQIIQDELLGKEFGTWYPITYCKKWLTRSSELFMEQASLGQMRFFRCSWNRTKGRMEYTLINTANNCGHITTSTKCPSFSLETNNYALAARLKKNGLQLQWKR